MAQHWLGMGRCPYIIIDWSISIITAGIKDLNVEKIGTAGTRTHAFSSAKVFGLGRTLIESKIFTGTGPTELESYSGQILKLPHKWTYLQFNSRLIVPPPPFNLKLKPLPNYFDLCWCLNTLRHLCGLMGRDEFTWTVQVAFIQPC